ncbi:MAG: glycosyltransferase [Vicinamibacterales bacterium]
MYTLAGNETYSYQRAWPRQFLASRLFDCTPIDLGNLAVAARLRAGWLGHRFNGDAVVLLHSVFSNLCTIPAWLVEALARLKQPKVLFIGNEYKLMPEKMDLCERLGLDLLISQSQSTDVHALYRRRLGCAVTGIPNTGLDAELFAPVTPDEQRPIDIGYRADDGPYYLGHRERRQIADYFTTHAQAMGLRADISMAPADRFDELRWAAFLNRCKGQLGTEAGGDYFDLDDTARLCTLALERKSRDVSFEEVYANCLQDLTSVVPLRILSGRNVEAAATGTTQILFEGRYDGYFVADEHYIPLKKDFSDVDDAVRKFRDAAVRSRVSANALALVRQEFTYDRLLARVEHAVAPLL